MSVTRNNHYVPQWYQEGFFGPGHSSLAYVDLTPDRLHELIAHTGHTMLLTIGEGDRAKSDELLKMARQVTAPLGSDVKAFVVTRNAAGESAADLLIDTSGAAHARLGGGESPSLCVIRPDGHLGLRLTPPALPAIKGYFSRIFA